MGISIYKKTKKEKPMSKKLNILSSI